MHLLFRINIMFIFLWAVRTKKQVKWKYIQLGTEKATHLFPTGYQRQFGHAECCWEVFYLFFYCYIDNLQANILAWQPAQTDQNKVKQDKNVSSFSRNELGYCLLNQVFDQDSIHSFHKSAYTYLARSSELLQKSLLKKWDQSYGDPYKIQEVTRTS